MKNFSGSPTKPQSKKISRDGWDWKTRHQNYVIFSWRSELLTQHNDNTRTCLLIIFRLDTMPEILSINKRQDFFPYQTQRDPSPPKTKSWFSTMPTFLSSVAANIPGKTITMLNFGQDLNFLFIDHFVYKGRACFVHSCSWVVKSRVFSLLITIIWSNK